MKLLNREGARLLGQVGPNACTDVTGFALLGHACEMAQKGGVRLRLYYDEMPFVAGAIDYANDNLFPGGSCNNQRAYEQCVDFPVGLSEEMQLLLFTPETSGGLLAAVSREKVARLRALFDEAGHFFRVVGEAEAGAGVQVV
jgi:selenide,water dikinase